MYLSLLSVALLALSTHAFVPKAPSRLQQQPLTVLDEMKRPLLDQLATALFNLEQSRVDASSVTDEQGREGEPMEWSEGNSLANRFSEAIASNSLGYQFKQWVADLVAGDFDQALVASKVDDFVGQNQVAMFSFTTCPFCRRAKDFLDEKGVSYATMELDLLVDNEGNQIRAMLGRKTLRTSVPSIFINGQYIGGCNDGPGLLPLAESGDLDVLLNTKN
jgi:glutaredoxin 3